MAIYLEYDGVKGNVTAEGFKDHVAILSAEFGAKRKIGMEPGKVANREATRPALTEITLIKHADKSTAAFFKESVSGSTGKKAVLKFVRTGADGVQQIMDYTLENALVSKYAINAGKIGDPVEQITLSYSKLLVSYHDHDASHKSAGPQRVGYDLTTAKPL
jgi:type VI secretion system secreted protein Hcp